MKLNLEEVESLIYKNSYLVNETEPYISRDSCGEYSNSDNIPALALPGGDIGQLFALFSAANSYAFGLDESKIPKIFMEIIGEKNHISFHSDHDTIQSLHDISCKSVRYITEHSADYDITQQDISSINTIITSLKSNHQLLYPTKSDVKEGAILLVTGNYGVLPRFSFMTDNGIISGSVFVYQKTLADKRNKLFAKKLYEENAVTLFEGLDEEYLYGAIADTMEIHFYQTIQHTLVDIPLYTVTFNESGTYTVEKQ